MVGLQGWEIPWSLPGGFSSQSPFHSQDPRPLLHSAWKVSIADRGGEGEASFTASRMHCLPLHHPPSPYIQWLPLQLVFPGTILPGLQS